MSSDSASIVTFPLDLTCKSSVESVIKVAPSASIFWRLYFASADKSAAIFNLRYRVSVESDISFFSPDLTRDKYHHHTTKERGKATSSYLPPPPPLEVPALHRVDTPRIKHDERWDGPGSLPVAHHYHIGAKPLAGDASNVGLKDLRTGKLGESSRLNHPLNIEMDVTSGGCVSCNSDLEFAG